jgi:hypothetical protein
MVQYEDLCREARARLDDALLQERSPEGAFSMVEDWIHGLDLPSDWRSALWLVVWSELPQPPRYQIVSPDSLLRQVEPEGDEVTVG